MIEAGSTETCLLPNIQYYSKDIRIYEITDEINYNYFIMNSKYNNDKRLEEGLVDVDVEANEATST